MEADDKVFIEERRGEDRFDLSQVGVWIKEAEHQKNPKVPFRPAGSLVDFSSRGLGIMTKEALKKEDKVIVRVKYGSKEMHALGTVIRRNLISGRDYEVGIEMDAAEREFIPKLIMSYCREQSNKQPVGVYFSIAIVSLIIGFVLGLLLPKLI